MDGALTANHEQAQAELFHEYNVGLFAHFYSFHLHADTCLTCHILDFAGETLGRTLLGKVIPSERTDTGITVIQSAKEV